MLSASETRPTGDEYAPFYGRYISLLPPGDVVDLLEAQHGVTRALLATVAEERAGHRYAPGKWSVREVVGHLADTERIMTYRALRAARGDRTPLPGFDEDAYAAAGDFDRRTLASLTAEWGSVRAATAALFRQLPEEAWTRRVVASDAEVSVRALACIVAGHELHHRRILELRYLDRGSGAEQP